MGTLILLRHGQSVWNKKKLFTGWVDVPLSPEGIEEAFRAGDQIKNISIDMVFVSSLVRAQMTAMLAMSRHASGKELVFVNKDSCHPTWGKSYGVDLNEACIPVTTAWEINERYYGELQGKNKDEVRAQYGDEQVHIWRRSYDIPPPEGESLELTAKRALPYFKDKIQPLLEKHNVLISAHGNSLRAIVMQIENLSKDEVLKLEIPTGEPRIYDCNNQIFTKHG